MTFNQLIFPFIFLPVSFILFKVVPVKFRKLLLLLLSLLFIVWGNPVDLPVILLSVVFNYFSCLQIAQQNENNRPAKAKITLTVSVVVNLLMLGYFKYFNFISENIAGLLKISAVKNTMPVPVGISFFTFSVLSALFDVYRKKAGKPKNILDFALFVTFFPKLTSGPIIQYNQMSIQLNELNITKQRTEAGFRMFIIGLAKKVLLANMLSITYSAVSGMKTESLTVLSAWTGALSYAFMLYFDFSGYSDMAVGLGRVFGFELPQNFRYPYYCDSISDFWRSWHASLGAWFKDYVYIPLGGSRQGKNKTIRNLLVVWLLTGIWHGANWTFILWGLYHGILIILEKFVLSRVVDKIPSFIKKIITFLLVVIGWVFFFSPDIGTAFSYIGKMFSFASLYDSAAQYYLGSSALLLIISAVGSLPLVRGSAIMIQKKKYNWFYIAQTVVFALMLIFSIAGMVSDTYSSFLYSQF